MSKGDFRQVLITGGAGFVGSNLAERLLQEPGTRVRVFDNLSRAGVKHNVRWLEENFGARVEILEGDVRNAAEVRNAVRDASEIYHLAAQVAVTTSVDDPASDFAINAQGTINVLEAARQSHRRPFVLYTSTNKVYGSLESVAVTVKGSAYAALQKGFRGVNESQPLDFHSPYGCSKGAADQYVHDYARIYDLPTVVFRMSCIAGPRQFGNEDQGWVAHFLYSALAHKPITIYGDGYQVRDVLHVTDLVEAMIAARDHRKTTAGNIYNLGGGMSRSISVADCIRAIEKLTGERIATHYRDTRPGDQPLYISDTSRVEHDTGWAAQRSLEDTLRDIHAFWHEHQESISAHIHHLTVMPELLAQGAA